MIECFICKKEIKEKLREHIKQKHKKFFLAWQIAKNKLYEKYTLEYLNKKYGDKN